MFSLMMFISATIMRGQSIPDMTIEKEFSSQVKSVDEFIQRFNGNESHPNLNESTNNRANNILALFNYQIEHENLSDTLFKKRILDFVHKVENNKVQLRLTGGEIYAVVNVTSTIRGKIVSLDLIFQSQMYKKGRVRWAIVGVKGMAESNVIDTANYYAISPTEHEIHFMGLSDIFAYNSRDIMGYRGNKSKVDELSVFLTMSVLDSVRINKVNNLTMYCLDVPDYVFTIDEFGRRGTNSGWLISSLSKVSNKEEYINKILGI